MDHFLVVVFLEDNSVATVPSIWVQNNCCKWPNFRDGAKLSRAISKAISPEESWSTHGIRILQSFSKSISFISFKCNSMVLFRYLAIYYFISSETYSEAFLAAKKAEETSDIGTDREELGRGRRKWVVNWKHCRKFIHPYFFKRFL